MIVSEGRITAAGPRSESKIPAAARRLDLPGNDPPARSHRHGQGGEVRDSLPPPILVADEDSLGRLVRALRIASGRGRRY